MSVQEIADQADMIVAGYTFKVLDDYIVAIQKFIKDNYETMYATWRTLSANGFYEKN